MSNFNETLVNFTKINDAKINIDDTLSSSVHDENFNNMVASAFTKTSETDMEYKHVINALASSPHFTSDPEKMQMLQNYVSEYSNYVSLVTTIARKAVSSIETLEKAQ